MSTVNPHIPLADASNQFRVDYIQDVASQPEFDYPMVSKTRIILYGNAYIQYDWKTGQNAWCSVLYADVKF